jgi:molybdopterin molybdotransferase
MTGAPVPAGADAVVMIEHVSVDGERVMLSRAASRGQSIVMRGKEARAGQQLLAPGTRLGYAEMALAGQVGSHRVSVFKRPRAAVLSTGDEVVDVSATPGPWQVRNGNSIALEALVALAGAESESLGNAPDERKELRRRIERGLEANLLIISGGVSMGKYDLVEMVLGELGTQFVFDSVAIRPGRPLPIFRARLAHALRERSELTHFLPARVQTVRGEPEVSALPWQGSGDVVTIAESNVFLIVPPEKLNWEAGEMAVVLPRRGLF